MAYYTALIAAWDNGASAVPSGVTGQTFTAAGASTTAAKLTVAQAWTLPAGAAIPCILTPSQIINACAAADLEGLTVTQIQLLALMLAGTSVNCSQNTPIRGVVENIFAGKTSLTSLAALVAPYDNPTIPWWQASVAAGGAGLSTFTAADLVNAGLS